MVRWHRAIAHGSIITLVTISHSVSAFVAPGSSVYVFSKMKPLSPDGGAAATIAAWRGRGVVGGIGSRGRAGGMPFTLRAARKESESVNGEKEKVLEEMQQTLQKKKGMLAEEIEQLELAKAQAQKQEEQKERGGVVGSTEEESEKEEQEPPRLPSGWDSLPWSQGYQDAVKRADQRRAQVESEDGWDGGVDRRSIVDSVLQGTLVVAIFLALGLVGNPSQEEVVENQMRFVALITDLTKGVQFVGTNLGPAVYEAKLELVQQLSAPGGELETSLMTPMEAWAAMQGPDLAPIQKSRVKNVRIEAARLQTTAQQGDVLEMRAAYRQMVSDVNGFILSVNANAPPTADYKLPQVPQLALAVTPAHAFDDDAI